MHYLPPVSMALHFDRDGTGWELAIYAPERSTEPELYRNLSLEEARDVMEAVVATYCRRAAEAV